jgi:hypothetical protein
MTLKEILDFLSTLDQSRVLSACVLFAFLFKQYILNGSVKRFFALKEREIILLEDLEKRLCKIQKAQSTMLGKEFVEDE